MNLFQNPAINRFADYFVICGLDICSGLELDRFSGDTLHCSPLDRPYKSKVLAHYPDNVPWNVFDHEAVSMLCLPHGLQFRTQKHSLEPRFHSFITTREDGSRTYGFSLVFFEEVTDRRICSAMQTLQAMHATEVASKRTTPVVQEGRKGRRGGGSGSSHSTRSLPRHFKLSVTQRSVDAGGEGSPGTSSQMEYDASQDSLYASKAIALVCQLPFVRAAKKFLNGLYKHAMELAAGEQGSEGEGGGEGEGGRSSSTTVSFNCDLGVFECLHLDVPLPLESYVHNLLYDVCIPQPGRSVRFWCFEEPLVLQRPSSIEEPPLFDFPLRLVFPLVGGPKRLLELFTCLLLENQVLLYSSDYQRLMLVAESITCLLFPFAWQHVYVPILPSSLTHFLDAPVPFVMGLPGPEHSVGHTNGPWMGPTVCLGCRSHRTKMASEANLCFVDLDNHAIQLPEDVPLFPQQQEFASEIYDLLAHYGVPSGDVHGNPVSESGLTSKSCPSCHNHRHRHKRRSRRKHSWSHDSDSASSSPTHSASSTRDHERRRSMRRTAVAAAAKAAAASGENSPVGDEGMRLGTAGLEASETLKRVLAIANNARVNISGLEGVLPHTPKSVDSNRTSDRVLSEQEQYVEDLKFNNALREVFLNRFVHMFSAYEHFVIQPDQDMEQWLSSRESMQNFDKATFLSDQPEPHLPFLSRFIESQMFATLIDNKILSCWQEVDPNLRVFDSRIRLLRKRFGDSLVRTPSYEPCTAIKETQLLLEKRLASVDSTAPPPRAQSCTSAYVRAREKARRQRIAAAQSNQSTEDPVMPQSIMTQSPFFALQSDNMSQVPSKQALEDRLGSTLERLQGQLERAKVGESMGGGCTMTKRDATPPLDAPKKQCHPPFPILDRVALNREPTRPPRERKGGAVVIGAGTATSAFAGGGRLGGERINSGGTLSSDALLKTIRQPKLSGEPSPAEIAQTNWSFVETLLKDVKMRTKRMLVEKMGSEAVELGHGTTAASLSGLEENTLMASLCDLLERIWSHGLQSKQGKSALWSHLLSFQELEDCSDTSKVVMDPNVLNPALAWCVLRKRLDYLSSMALETDLPLPRNGKFSTLPTRSSSGSMSNDTKGLTSSRTSVMTKSSGDLDQPCLAPLPVSVTFDMRSVQGMSEIKTEIGYARAWVRLSLEKKLLSTHLRALLSDYALLRSLYKRYAFLRSDDEKEQFLYHLLTLNAVDYFCFTNTYTNTKIPYRVLIFPAKSKGSAMMTSANAWVAAAGTLGGTSPVKIPRGSLEFIFHHKNLGILTTLRIGHDDTGPSPKWMVEHVVVRNEITGHSYKFPCGRWLGCGVDDDSTERLLVGEMMLWHSPGEVGMGRPSRGSRGGSREDLLQDGGEGVGEGAAHGSRRRRRRGSCEGCSSCSTPPPLPPSSLLLLSPLLPQHSPPSPSSNHRSRPPRQPTVPEIQQMLGDAVNSIVKYYYRPKQEKEGLTLLLCGEVGLVHCLGQVFLHGFKATRLFGKKLYLWDYFVKVKEELVVRMVGERREGGRSRSESRTRGRDVVRQYCRLIERIGNSSRTLGKDGKFQLFVCLGVREHLLHRLIAPLSASRTTLEMFEEQSFLRDPSLSMFLCQILQSLDEFEFVLENSLTKGMMDTL
ncbi:DENN domain-containing protein 5B [Hetaerina americana]|uniref:DENN domain-containing protein 5B n=1 Tax=Hetaerina americana TaxID=62018 RepID=UPI003A7F3422